MRDDFLPFSNFEKTKQAEDAASKNDTKKVDKNSFDYIMKEYQGKKFEDTDLYEKFIQGKMVRPAIFIFLFAI